MNKNLLFIYLSLSINFGLAQNLVPNPSFECGNNMGIPTQQSSDFASLACDWYCPTLGTSDMFYLNQGGAETWTSMPHLHGGSYGGIKFIGSQLPRSGNRFSGIITFNGESDNMSYREYIETRLLEPLDSGKKYCVQFYASPASKSRFAANNLGVSFHDQAANVNTYETLPFIPQIVEKKILTDTSYWSRVAGVFTAKSSAQYLTIGNFYSDQETDSVGFKTWNLTKGAFAAYYFIDDVSVESFPDNPIILTEETTICSGKSTNLQVMGNFEEVRWTLLSDTTTFFSNSKSATFSPVVTTSYRVKVKACNTFFYDTITVKVNPAPTINLGEDRIICQGDSIVLDAGVGYNSYLWENGATKQLMTVGKTGNYGVQVENEYNCSASDVVYVSVLAPPAFDLGKDVLFCSEFPQLKVKAGNGQQFLWSTGSTDSVMTPTHSGKYSLQVSNQCGTSKDTINIYSLRDVFIPNVVTVNNDDKNEQLLVAIKDDNQIQLNSDVSINGQLKIYDRWGMQIFSDESYKNNWPSVNENLTEGIYYYTFDYLNCPAIKGWVELIR